MAAFLPGRAGVEKEPDVLQRIRVIAGKLSKIERSPAVTGTSVADEEATVNIRGEVIEIGMWKGP